MCVACNAAPVPRDGSLTQLAFLDTLPPDWLPACDVPLFLLHKAPPAQAEAHSPLPCFGSCCAIYALPWTMAGSHDCRQTSSMPGCSKPVAKNIEAKKDKSHIGSGKQAGHSPTCEL